MIDTPFIRLELWYKAKSYNDKTHKYNKSPYAMVGYHDDEGMGVMEMWNGVNNFPKAIKFANKSAKKLGIKVVTFIDNVRKPTPTV